jgi:hypothetical protein
VVALSTVLVTIAGDKIDAEEPPPGTTTTAGGP